MKPNKIDFFSVNEQGEHFYEFSKMIQLNTKKPLTKIIHAKVSELGVLKDVKNHIRNSVYFIAPLNLNELKQKNVTKMYCLKSK